MESPKINLNLLPTEIIFHILLRTNFLNTLSLWNIVYRRASEIISEDIFWKQLYYHHYGSGYPLTKGNSWRARYKRLTLSQNYHQFSAGMDHYGIIDLDGTLNMSGKNNFGQLGRLTDINPPRTGGRASLLSQQIYYKGLKFPEYVPMEFKSRVINVCCGRETTGIVTEDGEAYLVGRDNKVWTKVIRIDGRRLLPISNIIKISFGYWMFGLITDDYSAYIWPEHLDTLPIKIPIKVRDIEVLYVDGWYGYEITVIIGQDDNLYLFLKGFNDISGYAEILDLELGWFEESPKFDLIYLPLDEAVKQIATYGDHIIALTVSGKVYSFRYSSMSCLEFNDDDMIAPDGTLTGIPDFYIYNNSVHIENPVEKLASISHIFSGCSDFSAISNNGKFYLGGKGSMSVNHGTRTFQIKYGNYHYPVLARDRFITIERSKEYNLLEMDSKNPTPEDIFKIKNVLIGWKFIIIQDQDDQLIKYRPT